MGRKNRKIYFKNINEVEKGNKKMLLSEKIKEGKLVTRTKEIRKGSMGYFIKI